MAKKTRLVHVLQAGKWSVSIKFFLLMLGYHLLRGGAEVLVITEVSPKDFRGPAKKWAKQHGFHVYHPKGAGADECLIISRKRMRMKRAIRVTKLRLKVGRVDPTFLIRCRIPGWGIFAILHTPAHTGGLRPDGKYAWPTRVYHSVREGVHTAMLGFLKATVSMDANLDMRMDKNRQLWEQTLPNLIIAAPKDQHPTEGGRVIDVTMTSLLILQPSKTLPSLLGFDHRGSETVLGRPA